MRQAKQGDTVFVHYRGTLDDGSEFDSSHGQDPLSFTLGSGEVVPGFEKAITGMTPGEKKKATLDSSEAYGERREDLVLSVGRDQLPDDAEVKVGDMLALSTPDGDDIPVQITAMDAQSLTLDANHPLAGKNLTFELELVSIEGA